jgi:hypothetical protein
MDGSWKFTWNILRCKTETMEEANGPKSFKLPHLNFLLHLLKHLIFVLWFKVYLYCHMLQAYNVIIVNEILHFKLREQNFKLNSTVQRFT